MKYTEIALVRGFDLFFCSVSERSVENMGKQLGGRYSFNAAEYRVTQMFERIKFVNPDELWEVHEYVDGIGQMLAVTYGCKYDFSELYVTLQSQRTTEV